MSLFPHLSSCSADKRKQDKTMSITLSVSCHEVLETPAGSRAKLG